MFQLRVIGEEFNSNGSRVGLLIRIRVRAGPEVLQSREYLTSGGLMMGSCGS